MSAMPRGVPGLPDDPLKIEMERLEKERPERLTRIETNRSKPWYIRIWSVEMHDDKVAEEKYQAWIQVYSPEAKRRYQASIEESKRAQEQGRALKEAEKAKKHPSLMSSLWGAIFVSIFVSAVSYFVFKTATAGLVFAGMVVFLAWVDYEQKVRKWRTARDAEVNARLDQLMRSRRSEEKDERP
jgi:hypothetical protein